MPGHGAPERPDLVAGFLDTVLTKGRQAALEGRAEALGGDGLGDPDQQNVLRPAPRPARRARHLLAHALEIGPHIVHEPYRRF